MVNHRRDGRARLAPARRSPLAWVQLAVASGVIVWLVHGLVTMSLPDWLLPAWLAFHAAGWTWRQRAAIAAWFRRWVPAVLRVDPDHLRRP